MKKLLIITILSTTAMAANADDHAAKITAKGTPSYPPKITFSQAKDIAVKAVRDSITVEEAELELEEDGNFTYEVEVTAGGVTTEVEINAETGEIMEIGADD